jgi:hypothetical protein
MYSFMCWREEEKGYGNVVKQLKKLYVRLTTELLCRATDFIKLYEK